MAAQRLSTLGAYNSPSQDGFKDALLESRIPRVVIVGTGFVGSTTAYALMMSGMAAEIVLIDRDPRRAEGQVNDLRDAEVFSHTTRVFAGDFSDCRSADITVITAGVSQAGQRSEYKVSVRRHDRARSQATFVAKNHAVSSSWHRIR
jgi:2-polyprenyl-6-methoxyphenol hydroxylase-like FAD-dependent oxidoreductase